MKSRIKTKVRQFKKTLEKGTTDAAAPLLKEAASLLDRAASKGILHKRTASRKISRLAKKLHKAGGRVSAQA